MTTDRTIALSAIELEDGRAEPMGDGIFIVMQRDEAALRKPMMNVVLTKADLEAMLAAA